MTINSEQTPNQADYERAIQTLKINQQKEIIKELKSLNSKISFFVFLTILGIIWSFLSAILF
ncbi:MAG TPA: hypothetical protein PKD23_06785 [Bellilinea sp.]|nr:hypothetical protein [Bellilinea sp.]